VPPNLDRARDDLAEFARLVGYDLMPWQADALKLERRYSVVVAPRQVGKSRSLALLGLWWAFRRPGAHVLLVSAGEEASRRLLGMAAEFASSSPLLRGSVVDEFASLLTLSNGARLKSVPASERQIRGEQCSLLLCDEAAIIDSDLLLNACIPTTSAEPDARLVFASSPGAPEGAFYDLARQGDEGVEHVQSFHWSLSDATWVIPSVVDAARASLAPAAFTREMLGEFADTGIDERVCERAWIERAQRLRFEESSEPVFAVDVARHGGDETIIVRISGGRARVVWAAKGLQSIMPIASQIETLSKAEPGPAPRFLIDVDGIGWGVFDRCNQIGGLRVSAFQGGTSPTDRRRHLNRRAEAWWTAREALRTSQVDLDPSDSLLAAQLGAVTYSLDLAGHIVIQSKRTMRQSPDRGDAIVMAIWAAARQNSGEQIRLLLEESTKSIAEQAARGHEPSEIELSAEHTPTEQAFGGHDRRGWRARLDPDLPTFYGG
jgi:hypothetical protein